MLAVVVSVSSWPACAFPGSIECSRDSQLQHDALTEAGCGRIYTDKVSTRKAASERQGLAAALGYLRPGDILVISKLDRLGRSVKEVLTIADDFADDGSGGMNGACISRWRLSNNRLEQETISSQRAANAGSGRSPPRARRKDPCGNRAPRCSLR